METTRIAFIGAGNMAASIIGGLVQHGWPANNIVAADCDQGKLDQLQQRFQIRTQVDNEVAITEADVVILAVKPQVMRKVLLALVKPLAERQPLLISIAAGIRTQHLQRWSGLGNIVRCMPNTPALVQTGATGLFAGDKVSMAHRQLAERLLGAVGITVWVASEQELDLVTALSGSGPAYFFLFMEAMETAAQSLGLSPQAAHQLTLQTALGAAKMAAQSQEGLAVLRKNVTSPGGTTEKAILSFENHQLRQAIRSAIEAAFHRSIELSLQFGDEQ